MNNPKIIRVFPRRTKATPIDPFAFVGDPPLWAVTDGMRYVPDEIHVSCTFTWDLPDAQRLVKAWQFAFPSAIVQLGGPALGDPGGEFVPGRYLAPGYTITSRGCPNRCERCMVPAREGKIRTLSIRDGFDVLDNNLLACPLDHIENVLQMLRRQKVRPKFTGGLEAARLTLDKCDDILSVKPDVLFLAYDRPEEREAVERAIALIRERSGWGDGAMRHHVGCYILCGYEGDTVAAAEQRVAWIMAQNVRAYPMYFRDEAGTPRPREWDGIIGGTLSFGGA